MKPLFFIALLLATTAASVPAQSVVPKPPLRISYQGYLVDANGVPLGDTTPKNYDAVFRIYDSSSGGTNLWTEQQTITVDKGYFSVLLGEGGTLQPQPKGDLDTVFNSGTSDRYIGITVKGLPTTAGIEIAPRIQFLSTPYAMVAAHAKVADQAKEVVSTNGTSVLAVTTTTAGVNRVGINQPNPAHPLDVTGDIRSSGTVRATAFEGTLNAANLTGTIAASLLPAEIQGTVPVGGIILWSGIDRNLDASGWALCDGQTRRLYLEDGGTMDVETPDLRDRFVMGSARINALAQGGDIGETGGRDTVTLTTANLPPHTHDFRDNYQLLDSSFKDAPTGAKFDDLPVNYYSVGKGSTADDGDALWYFESTTKSTGSGTPVAITPKYYRLAYIIRWK